MKNDFEITVPQIDFIVDIIAEHIGVCGGVRMTGGGFGGCVVALVPTVEVKFISELIRHKYEEFAGKSPSIFTSKAAAGAGILK